MVSRKIVLAFLGLIPCAALAQTPTYVHSLTGENSRTWPTAAPNDYYIPDAEVTIAGNCLGAFAIWSTATSPTATISDDKSDSYSQIKLVTGSSNAASLWIAPNVAAGAHKIDIHFTTVTSNVIAETFEISNCPASSPVDVSAGQELSGTSISSGSLTPNASGEFIIQVAAVENLTVPATSSFTAGSQSFCVTSVAVFNTVGSSAVTAAAQTTLTASGIPGTYTLPLPSGTTAGSTTAVYQLTYPNGLKGALGTNVVFTLPTFATNQTIYVNVCGHYGA